MRAAPPSIATLCRHGLGAVRRLWDDRHDRLTPAALFLSLVSLAATFGHGGGTWVADFRFAHNHNPGRWFSHMASVWDTTRGFGTFRSDFWPGPTVFFGVLDLLGVSPAVAQRLFHATLFAVLGVGMVELLRRWDRRIGTLHVAAALYTMFCPFAVAFLLPSGLFLGYAILPWILVFAIDGMRSERAGDTWRSAAALTLLTVSVGAVDRGGLVFSTIAVLVVASGLVFVERTATIASCWAWAWRTMVLGVPALAASLVGLVLTAEVTAQDLRETELADAVNVASSWPESFRGLGFWLLYLRDQSGWSKPPTLPYSNERWLYLVTFVVPVIALLVLAINRRRERLVFGALTAVGLVLMVGRFPVDDPSPWGIGLGWLYDAVPASQILRNSFKAGALVSIGTGALFGMGAAATHQWAQRRSDVQHASSSRPGPVPGIRRLPSRLVRRVPPAVLGIAVVLAAVATPVWRDGIYDGAPGYDEIPVHQTDAMAWLEELPDGGRTLFLPGASRLGFRWGAVNDDIIDAFATRPYLIDVSLHASRPVNADILSALERSFVNRTYEPGLARAFGERYGIDHVLLRNDIDWQVWGQPRPADYDAFRADPDTELVAAFGEPGAFTTSPGDNGVAAQRERLLAPVEIYRITEDASMVEVRPHRTPLLVAGDGEAIPLIERSDTVGAVGPIRFTGDLDPSDLTDHLQSGSPLLVTDTNRRVTEYITISPQQSQTLSPADETERDVFSLFDRPGAETTSWLPDATRIQTTGSVSISGDAVPWNRPALGVDGSEQTSWLVGGLGEPIGERYRVELRGPTAISGVRLRGVPAPGAGERQLGAVTISFSDGTVVPAALTDGRFETTFRPIEATWAEVVITGVDGVGVAPVGFSSLDLVGADLREHLQLPDDVFRAGDADPAVAAALDDAAIGYAFERLLGNGPVDVEREVRRHFRSVDSTGLTLRGHLQVGGSAPDALLAQFEGREVSGVGSSRYRGLVQFRGNGAVDGDPTTAWVADATERPTLTVTFPEQMVSLVRLDTRHGAGISQLRGVEVRIGDQVVERSLASVSCADQCPLTLDLELPEPVLASELTIVIRSASGNADGSNREQPIRLDEVELNGEANVVRALARPGGCRSDLLVLDGEAVPVRLDSSEQSLLIGARTAFRSCDDVDLDAGWHRLESRPGVLLDDATLLPDGFADPVDATAAAPASTVRWLDQTTWSAVLGPSPADDAADPDGDSSTTLLLRQSYHPSWQATLDGEQLDRIGPIDGFAAWEIPPGAVGELRVSLGVQRSYEVALLITGLGTLLSLTVLCRAGRQPAAVADVDQRRLGVDRRGSLAAPTGLAAAVAALAVVAGGYVVGGWLGLALAGSIAAGTWRPVPVLWQRPAFLAAVTVAATGAIGAGRSSFSTSTFSGAFASAPNAAVVAGRLGGVLLICAVVLGAARERRVDAATVLAAEPWSPRRGLARLRDAVEPPAVLFAIAAAALTTARPLTMSGAGTEAARQIALGRRLPTDAFPLAPILTGLAPFGARLTGAVATGVTVLAVLTIVFGPFERPTPLPRWTTTFTTHRRLLGIVAVAALLWLRPPLPLTLTIAVIASLAAASRWTPGGFGSTTVGVLVALACLASPYGVLSVVAIIGQPTPRRRLHSALVTLAIVTPWLVWVIRQ